jgi:hypothetical protein
MPFDQLWSTVKGAGAKWHSSALHGRQITYLWGREKENVRHVRVQIGVAHVNGVAGDDRAANLAAWCRWCHLLNDREQHHQTRANRKDAARPLLQCSNT